MFRNTYNRLVTAAIIMVVLTLLVSIKCALPPEAPNMTIFPLVWSVLALIALLITYRSPCVGVLLSIFCLLTIMRTVDVDDLFVPSVPATLAFFVMAILFFYIAFKNVRYFHASESQPYHINARLSAFEWHLTFVRMYIGFNLVAHFGEKLFAGTVPFQADVNAFVSLGVPHPEFFVLLAGLCELGGAISVGLGFFTRVGAIGTTLYLVIATLLGGHFLDGFIWANKGGGWEYPVFWSILLLSFSVLGAGRYSIDAAIKQKYKPARWIHHLMG